VVRAGRLLMIALAGLVLTGCVERRFVISTDPFGAVVYDMCDQPMGLSPADKSFTYYGRYRFKLVKDGYKTMIVEERIKAPWYEWPGLDFISENLLPYTVRDIRRLNYKLEPVEIVSPDKVQVDGEMLRQRGATIGTTAPP
jgi:hypothetical protein